MNLQILKEAIDLFILNISFVICCVGNMFVDFMWIIMLEFYRIDYYCFSANFQDQRITQNVDGININLFHTLFHNFSLVVDIGRVYEERKKYILLKLEGNDCLAILYHITFYFKFCYSFTEKSVI